MIICNHNNNSTIHSSMVDMFYELFCADLAEDVNETPLQMLKAPSLIDILDEFYRRRQKQGRVRGQSLIEFRTLKRNGFDPLAIGGRFGKRLFDVATNDMYSR